MHTENGVIHLTDAAGISAPANDRMDFVDKTGMRFTIPLRAVIRLYNIAKHESERRGKNWEEECERILN